MSSRTLKEVTGDEVGYSGDDQIRICLHRIVELGGIAQMRDLYAAMEALLNPKGWTLSQQGKSSLRFFVNEVAVNKGYIYPHDKQRPGWRITPEGRTLIRSEVPASGTAEDVEQQTDEPPDVDVVIDNQTPQVQFQSLLAYVDQILGCLAEIESEHLLDPDGTTLFVEGPPHQIQATVRAMMGFAYPGEISLGLTVSSDGWHVRLDARPEKRG